MAFKPHVVKLAKGQATLIYMSSADASLYEEVLTSYDKNSNRDSACTDVAIGKWLNPEDKKYHIVTIKYNPLTKNCFVESVVETSTSKSRANDELKKSIGKNKLLD